MPLCSISQKINQSATLDSSWLQELWHSVIYQDLMSSGRPIFCKNCSTMQSDGTILLWAIGMNYLNDTISMHFFHKDLRNRIEDIVSWCDACQCFKQVGRSYGKTAPWEAVLSPWREIACDLIGLWKLDVGNQLCTFSALTIIDTVTNLVEIIRLDHHSSAHVALHFENTWLSCYPNLSPASMIRAVSLLDSTSNKC